MAQDDVKSIDQLNEEADIAADYLEGLLDIADYEGDIEMGVRNDRPTVQIVADDDTDIKHLIGRNGEVVDALQQLTRLAVQQKTGERSHLIVDVDGFLKRKRQHLRDIALDAIDAVKDSGEPKSKINEVILVGGMTRMPKAQETAKNIFGKEPHKGVNPDEVVAAGAAIQGGVLNKEVDNVVLLDVTPLSLGIETLGGVTTKLIDRNTTIPTKKSEIFSTAADNQPSVDIHVLQGERNMAADNKSIGRFRLDGIAPAPRGVPQIEVTFDIDANGILSVTAKDLGTGKEQKITITASSGLSEEEIQRMVNDAKAHENEDKAAKEKIEVKNKADSMVYQTEKQLKDLGDKLSPDVRTPVQESIDKLKKDIERDDTEAMKATMKELEERLMKFGEEIYKQQQAQGAAGAQAGAAPNAGAANAGGQKPDDGVVDAEIVDDDK